MRAAISLLFILLFNIVVFSQDISLSANSAEKYNERGFFKNENLTLNGNEIISNYDGNLMANYSTKINLPADLSGDFTITYNTNVEHRVFAELEDLEVPKYGYMINSPEWILGFKGIALQALNFETNFYSDHEDPNSFLSVHTGEEIALLIPGYHYNNCLDPQSNDFINILRADGSKIILQNTKEGVGTGLYKEVGIDAKGFAIVENYTNSEEPGCTTYRKIWYKPGDGLTYVFEEKRVDFNGYVFSGCYNYAPRAMYLTEIYSPGSYKYGEHLQFLYANYIPTSDPANPVNIINGRKVFVGIKVTPINGSTLNYRGSDTQGSNTRELEVNYIYSGTSLVDIHILNHNLNKELTLAVSAPKGAPDNSNIGLFSTARDVNNMRKLDVTSITDDLLRKDEFSYYNWSSSSNTICSRHYRIGGTTNMDILFKVPLLEKISYHTGKSSEFNYYENEFTAYNPITFFDFKGNTCILANRTRAYRDCFTNFMLKSHDVFNKYGETSTLAKEDIYSYTFDGNSGGTLVSGIKTIVNKYEGSSKVPVSTQENNYSNFRTNKLNLYASDLEYVIKLMSEKVTEAVNIEDIEEDVVKDRTEVEKDYTYADGGQDASSDCYTGNFDIRTVKEIKTNITTSASTERTDNITNQYDYASITYGGKSLSIQVKSSESRTDPKSLVKYTEYKNIFPQSDLTNYQFNWNSPNNDIVHDIEMVYDNSKYFYMIGLPREENLQSSDNKVLSDVVKEYQERGYLAGKLTKVINNTKITTAGGNTNVDKQSYNIYSYVEDDPSHMSLLSSIENDKGARQDFIYSKTSNFQEAIPGIIVKYDQSRTQTTFYHNGYQMQPFKTVTSYLNPAGGSETLINYSSYNPDGTLQFEVNENGLYSAFTYDKVGRLISAALPGSFTSGATSSSSNQVTALAPDLSQTVGTVVYKYGDADHTITKNTRVNSNPDPLYFAEVTSMQKLDGLEHPRENFVKIASGTPNDYEHKSSLTYNSLGNVIAKTTYQTDILNFTDNFSYDFLQRLTKQTNGNGNTKNNEYIIKSDIIYNGSIPAVFSEYTVQTDENKNSVITYYDKLGNKVAEKVGANPPTIFQYDGFNRIIKVISPAGSTRTYSYDDFGNLGQKDSPADEGTTKYKYDKYKRLRFSMNSAAPTGERGITFTKYDQLGRVLITGTLPSNYGWDALDANKDYSIDQNNQPHFENYIPSLTNSDTSNFVTVNMYDSYTKSGIFAAMDDPFYWSPNDANSSRNLKGNLVLAAFRDKPGQGWNYRIYLYDALGKVNYIYQKMGTAPWKYIFKETDALGNQKRELLFKISGGSSVYEHAMWNNYDKEGRLWEVRSDPAGNYSTSKQEAVYTYNQADQCSTLTYSQVTNANNKTTYTYDTRGWLSKIQNGSNNFYEGLYYYNNGNIQTQTITNSVLGGTQTISYNYDAMNRLTSVLSGGSTRESFQYDYDGNISQRNYLSGGALKGLYFVPSGNRISSVFTDMDEFSIYYDYKGNVNADQYSGITNITYDHRNLPLSMTTSTNSTYKYRYDDGGNRIYKDANGHKEFYFRDDLGHEVAVYDVATDRLSMVNLYGNNLIGRIDCSYTSQFDNEIAEYVLVRSDARKYYVKDHLGSIRQTLNESGTVMSAMDYYAFGGTRSSYVNGSTVDKYKFTGKERDQETGLDYFGARYYNPFFGRWMSVDPFADIFPGLSPYNYCYNNPLRYIDELGLDPDTKEKVTDPATGYEYAVYGQAAVIYAYGWWSRDYYNNVPYEKPERTDNKDNQNKSGDKASLVMLGVSQVPSMVKEGFATAQQFSIGPVSNFVTKGLSVSTKTGIGLAGVSVTMSTIALIKSNRTGADVAKFAGSFIITGSAFIPAIGVPLSITLGVMDGTGKLDPIYERAGSMSSAEWQPILQLTHAF